MFRYLERFSKYGITRDGRVFNHSTQRWLGGNTKRGYVTIHLRDDNGIATQEMRHRLVAMAWVINEDPAVNIVVNHLNGIPGDDCAENLEWTTYKKNVEHAGSMGLTDKCLPVSVRNPKTGEVKHFPSASEAGRILGLTKDAILWRLECGEHRVFPEGYQYRQRDDSRQWSNETDEGWGRSVPVIVSDLKTGKVHRFAKQSDCAEFLGIALSTINVWMTKGVQRVFNNRYVVKPDDGSPWREVKDTLRENKARRPVVVIDDKTGKETTYSTAKECADAMGLLTTTLNERLKNGDKKVWKDGFRYRYY